MEKRVLSDICKCAKGFQSSVVVENINKQPKYFLALFDMTKPQLLDEIEKIKSFVDYYENNPRKSWSHDTKSTALDIKARLTMAEHILEYFDRYFSIKESFWLSLNAKNN